MEQSRQSSLPEWSDPVGQHGWSPLKWLVGLLSLALRSGGELAHLAGRMHHTIAQVPPVVDPALLGLSSPATEHHAIPKTYALVRLLLTQGADQLHRAIAHLPSQDHLPVPLRRVHSGMNGVFGDKLQEWGHPLALSMEVVDEQGRVKSLSELQARHRRGVLLFVHGLCLSEQDWQTRSHQRFVSHIKQQDIGVAWLRYNSGLPIWENGVALSQLLAERWQPAEDQSLMLAGHSMGGLVIRSALHHGEHVHASDWVHSVTHAAYLASPHAGAPLEKIGNFANSLLGVSPYSRPLMALGNIRSRGIRSLRDGAVVKAQDDHRDPVVVPFSDRMRHLLLAARMGDDPAKRWLGDGLVPLASAMGEGHFPPQHAQIERVVLDDVGHIRLLADERLYAALVQWLNLPPLD